MMNDDLRADINLMYSVLTEYECTSRQMIADEMGRPFYRVLYLLDYVRDHPQRCGYNVPQVRPGEGTHVYQAVDESGNGPLSADDQEHLSAGHLAMLKQAMTQAVHQLHVLTTDAKYVSDRRARTWRGWARVLDGMLAAVEMMSEVDVDAPTTTRTKGRSTTRGKMPPHEYVIHGVHHKAVKGNWYWTEYLMRPHVIGCLGHTPDESRDTIHAARDALLGGAVDAWVYDIHIWITGSTVKESAR